jgi:hypothetical protein
VDEAADEGLTARLGFAGCLTGGWVGNSGRLRQRGCAGWAARYRAADVAGGPGN